MKKNKPKIIVIVGPTASGKTRVGVRLAKKFNGEIISADSRQVYKGMDVGTGKDLNEYKAKSVKSEVKSQNMSYHLIDVVEPMTEFNVVKFQRLAFKAIEDILARGRVPIIVGGTGLYVDAVVDGFVFNETTKQQNNKTRKRLEGLSLKQLLAQLKKIDPVTYKIIDQQNRRRVQRALEIYYQTGLPKSQVQKKQKPSYDFLKIGLAYPREIINQRIDRRLLERLTREGLVAEVRRLHRQGVSWKRLEGFGLEYRWVSWFLRGQVNYDEMVAGLGTDIKKFAKRQMTWFKRDKEIRWENDYKKVESLVNKLFK